MFCFTDILSVKEELVKISKEQFSSFSIFPFTLNFMGYKNSDLINNFYPKKKKKTTEFQGFISGDIFNRGNTFKWNFIDEENTIIND